MSPDKASRLANGNIDQLVEIVYIDGTTVAGYSEGTKLMPPLISLVGELGDKVDGTTVHLPPSRIHRLSPVYES